MSDRSTWDVIRKRIAPVAFIAALVLLATRTCGSEMAEVELRFDPGSARAELRSLHVTVHRAGDAEPVAFFDRQVASGPRAITWKLSLDPGSYRLAIRAELRSGERRTFDRRIEAESGATITLDLERHFKE